MLAIVCLRLFLRSDKEKVIALINQTIQQYELVSQRCRAVFMKKNHDYGPSWRIMRISSIIDQIFIKANRIRTLEEKGMSRVNEGVEPEWMGIINYCIMGLIQIDPANENKELSEEMLLTAYDYHFMNARNLMEEKNHDYGEIWRSMLVSTFTDMLLMRVNRMHQILENKGKTLMSEGIDSNLMDMINYSVFALIRLEEQSTIKQQ